MRQRILTAIIIIGVLIPIFYSATREYRMPVYILGLILTIFAMSELISVKETENKLPFEVHVLSFFTVLYLSYGEIFIEYFNIDSKYFIGLHIIPFIAALLAIVMVLRNHFKFNDVSYVLFSVLYIGLCFHSLVYFLPQFALLIYLILIAILTDTFAYFTGYFFGKHPLAPKISPKKTIEGSIGGSIIATAIVSIYAYFTFANQQNIILIIFISLLLTIVSQFGDLIASAIKRQYKVKDYGNLFPGHGGVLDRLDSILFTALIFFYIQRYFFYGLIG